MMNFDGFHPVTTPEWVGPPDASTWIMSTDTTIAGPCLDWGITLPDNDTRPPSAPIDTVIGDLSAGRVVQQDRMRLGKALDKANADASGPKVKGFDHIVGRVPGGMATLTGRD
jgi:hypothetical protein